MCDFLCGYTYYLRVAVHDDRCSKPTQTHVLPLQPFTCFRYAAVGLNEHIRTSIQLLELMAPTWFANATRLFDTKKSHGDDRLMQTPGAHEPPSDKVISLLREFHPQDFKLYEFAKLRFERMAKNHGLMLEAPAADAPPT
jgi:hypothetical protein